MSEHDKRCSPETNDSARETGNVLKEFLHTFTKGRALDLACGEGRNAIFLAGNGYQADAVDSLAAAIEKGRRPSL